MRGLRVLLAGSVLLCVSEVSAGVITCNLGGTRSSWASMDTPFELNVTRVNPAKNVHIGLGSNIQDYTVLYQIKRVNVGVTSLACAPIYPELHYSILRSDDSAPVKIGADYIYKTSVPGIGISLESYNSPQIAPLRLYPQTVKWGDLINDLGLWLHIKIWKIPGTVPVSSGPISFTGPTVGQILLKNGYTFATSNPERLWDNNKGWVASSRQLQGTLIFEQNTCNLEMGSKTVLMGKYGGSGGGKSSWKDASFKLNCPNAWGYGGTTKSWNGADGYSYPDNVSPNSAITANTQKNGPLRIQIIPCTPVVDAAKGILALDGSGAQGYGIQLAWGEHGTLGAGEPAKPVILNNWTKASELNSAYRSSEYVPGATVIPTGADGTIRMAARYIRTPGSVQPGPANAAVEVIASYQ